VNLLLLEPGEVEAGDRVWLTGRRARHLLQVLHVEPGRTLRAGVAGGATGLCEVVEVGADRVSVRFRPQQGREVADPAPLRLILALPRPKVLRRVLRAVASLGVPELRLINAWRVEKSYFSSPLLAPAALREELLLGCEQGGHPRLPEVKLEPLLVPFLEALPAATSDELRLLADPGAGDGAERLLDRLAAARRLMVAVGPEGGWTDRERESFLERGFAPLSLGTCTLATEVAVSVLIGQLQLLGRMVAAEDPIAIPAGPPRGDGT
jgi:16S rRNA (uracil1498-N3)-methyltransferase